MSRWPGHVRPLRVATSQARHQCITAPLMSTLDKTARAPDGGGQGEFMVTNNRTTTAPIIPLHKVQVHGSVSIDDDQDAKLVDHNAQLRLGAGRATSNLLGYLLVRGIKLRSLKQGELAEWEVQCPCCCHVRERHTGRPSELKWSSTSTCSKLTR